MKFCLFISMDIVNIDPENQDGCMNGTVGNGEAHPLDIVEE